MPMYELGLPVSASSPKITHNGVDYSLVLGTDTFTRVGKDGNEVVLPLCGGDEFVGEVLEGEWKKGYTGAWKAANPFTAILESTNNLMELGGLSNVQNVWVYGWIDGHHPIVMMNELEVNVLLEVPTNTASGANQGFKFRFFITKGKIVTQPNSENDYIKIEMDVTDGGLLLNIFKHIGGAGEVTLFHGSTYDGDTVRAATGRVTIWRVVFHDGVAGATTPGDVRHMHIYLKQGATRAAADGATEYELIDAVTVAHASPYNISDLLFNVGYPAYEIGTEDDTDNYKQDTNDEAMSEYLKVSYPALFALKYDFVDASYGYGDVELWDMKGSVTDADFQQVFDEDHSFGTYDIVLQNGLVRLLVDRVQQYGLEFYYWTGAAWVQPFDQLFFHAVTSNKDLTYPVIKSIESISPEKTAIVVRLLDSDTVNDDYYVDLRITLERGKYTLQIDSLDVFPDQDVRFWFLNTTTVRFGYVQDTDVGDDDIAEDGDNTTMTDNFLIALDDAGEAVLGVVFTDEKPAGGSVRFFASDGGDLSIEDVDAVDTATTIIWVALIPFTLIAELFLCASEMVKDGAADTHNPGVGEACALVLRMAAQDDGGHWIRTGATHLPEGRYLAILRDHCITANQNYDARVYNNDDSEYRNEEAAYVTFQAQVDAWTYRKLVFDVTAADVTGTDDIWIQVVQPNVGPNTVYIDYILLIPIGDGKEWPQDLAHATLRSFTKPRRLYVR